MNNRLLKRTELKETTEFPHGSVIIKAIISNIPMRYKLSYNTSDRDDGNSEMLWIINLNTGQYMKLDN